jgi:hypothetical protein
MGVRADICEQDLCRWRHHRLIVARVAERGLGAHAGKRIIGIAAAASFHARHYQPVRTNDMYVLFLY